MQSPTITSAVTQRQVANISDFRYSVVIPVFDAETTIAEVIRRTSAVFESRQCSYEIVCVNDGSSDDSWSVLREQARNNRNVVAIDLIKNYGQHPAMFCGLKHSTGDFVVTIDGDLQNPPEEIFKLVDKALEGYDLVFGQFKQKKHSFVRRLGSRVIGLLNEKIFGKPKDLKVTNYRLMSRSLVNRMCRYRTAFPYLNGLALKFSGPRLRANVMVEHCERQSGKSAYTPRRIAQLVLTILFNYSSYPLALVSVLGLTVSLLSFALGVFLICKRLLIGAMVPGWTSIVVIMSFFNGILTLLLGMLGEYVIRILNTVSDNSCYEIGEVCKVD